MGRTHSLLVPKLSRILWADYIIEKNVLYCFAKLGVSSTHLRIELVLKILLWYAFVALRLRFLFLLTRLTRSLHSACLKFCLF